MGRESHLLDRYLAGEHVPVYAELAALGPAVHDDPYREQADAVAAELMRRVRRNAELLSERWREAGWEFGYDWAGDWAQRDVERAPAHLGVPEPDAAERLDRVERRLGPVPLVLRAFMTQVGSVNFVGYPSVPDELHDASDEQLLAAGWVWPGREECDPIQVGPRLEALQAPQHTAGRCYLPLWPDRFHKFFLSGAGEFGTWLPQPGFDPPLFFSGSWLIEEEGTTRFLAEDEPIPGWTLVPYLRDVLLAEGGFGVEVPHAFRHRAFIDEITADLEPF